MTRLEIITNLTKTGEIIHLYQLGMISYKVLMYRDIYFDLGCEYAKGVNRTQAVQNVADKYVVSTDTVWRAIRYVTTENSGNNTASRSEAVKVPKTA